MIELDALLDMVLLRNLSVDIGQEAALGLEAILALLLGYVDQTDFGMLL